MLELYRVGQVDGRRVEANVDRLDGGGAGHAQQSPEREGRKRRGGAQKGQKEPPNSAAGATRVPTIKEFPVPNMAGFTPNSRPGLVRAPVQSRTNAND
jgi:hypothetical protein